MGTPSLLHGGDLTAARQLFPAAPEPFIDLSTGINPHFYPLPELSPSVFTRLPEPTAVGRLAAAAAEAYGAPSAGNVVCAPGTQILLPLVAALVSPGNAAVLGPTYSEHVRVATLVGHRTREVADAAHLKDADLAIVVNPNNPDGRIVGRDTLLALADEQSRRGGLLVIDEAFADVGPADISLAGDVARGNIVVLRSFGKFFGLAGLRLGFALAATQIAARLNALLGPWAVAGPAIAVGELALTDALWARDTRAALCKAAERLDQMLASASLQVVGGAPLFRLVRTPVAPALFNHLGRAGILVRRFDQEPTELRFGLPGGEEAWARLGAALAAFR